MKNWIIAILMSCVLAIGSEVFRPKEIRTHYLLPKSAQCAVKMMYFRDSENKKYPAVRHVCHWENE